LASWAKEDSRICLRFDWPALGLDPQKTLLHAPAVAGFQEARTFQPGDEFTARPKHGRLLILGEQQ